MAPRPDEHQDQQLVGRRIRTAVIFLTIAATGTASLTACARRQPRTGSDVAPTPSTVTVAGSQLSAQARRLGSAPPPRASTQAAATAAAFAAAWTRRGLPTEQWWEADFAAKLRAVDPATLPAATAVTGPPETIGAPSAGEPVHFTVPTDAGILILTVAARDGAWRVTSSDFARYG
jgi:hypothetical protein